MQVLLQNLSLSIATTQKELLPSPCILNSGQFDFELCANKQFKETLKDNKIYDGTGEHISEIQYPGAKSIDYDTEIRTATVR